MVLPHNGPPWWLALHGYWDSNDVFLCPEARKPGPYAYVERNPFEAWQGLPYPGVHFVCSYGVNGWLAETMRLREVADMWDAWGKDDFQTFSQRHWYWSGRDLDTTSLVPLLADSVWSGAPPEESDTPPEFHGDFVVQGIGTMQWNRNINLMKSFCLDRHGSGRTNMTFLDGSAHPVGLKELWTLKWYRGCPPSGRWTKAGGALPSDWPKWMRGFKDY